MVSNGSILPPGMIHWPLVCSLVERPNRTLCPTLITMVATPTRGKFSLIFGQPRFLCSLEIHSRNTCIRTSAPHREDVYDTVSPRGMLEIRCRCGAGSVQPIHSSADYMADPLFPSVHV